MTVCQWKMLLTLQHENLVAYYQIFSTEGMKAGYTQFAMNYCPDGDLAQLILHFQQSGSKMPLKMFLDYAQQMAQGLAFLHKKGIMHPDVRPSHLLVTRPKANVNLLQICGLAEAVILEREKINSSRDISIPPYANVMYTPPELLQKGRHDIAGGGIRITEMVCLKSNIWAAGCIIQELAICCISGKGKWLHSPYGNKKLDSSEQTLNEYTRRLMEGWVPYIGEPIPTDLARRVMEGCFAEDPDDRFTALELSNKLIEIEESTYGTTWNDNAVDFDMELSIKERQTHRLNDEDIGVICQYEYNWKDIIGQGGFASVFKAKITQWGNYTGEAVVAVKEIVLNVDTIRKWKKDGSSAKLKHQWRSLLELHHDYLVRYHKITVRRLLKGTGVSFLMDYCEGGSLHDLIKEWCKTKGALSVELLKRYAVQITTGLRYLHQNGFIHGDLKPSNLLLKLQLDGQFKVLIGDFDGSVRLGHGTMAGSRECKALQWTVPYMSPEMVMMVLGEPHQPISYWTDIWSLGCVMLDLADCFCGIKERYYHKTIIDNDADGLVDDKIQREHYDSFAFLFKLSQGYVPCISELIPQALADIINSCFIHDPMNRITTDLLFAEILRLT